MLIYHHCLLLRVCKSRTGTIVEVSVRVSVILTWCKKIKS